MDKLSRGAHYAFIARHNLQTIFPALLSRDPELQNSISRSIHYSSTPPHTGGTSTLSDPSHRTKFYVVDSDSFDCAERIVLRDPNVPREGICVLNMASHQRAGGGWINGASAQEEALCRRSTLFLHIEGPKAPEQGHSWYPHGPTAGTWSEGVLVFRNSDAGGNKMLEEDKRFKCNVVSVAAILGPVLTPDQASFAKTSDAELTRQKITTILRIAKLHRQKVLVLGAFGCGAFRNPPTLIAPIFYDLLTQDAEFTHAFEEVWFAILDFGGSANLVPFRNAFATLLERDTTT
ncbi:hypothetical protein BOTBODRAFT_33077 [Botryobasidium botryosum FD-172 SS1]|uniref:Microbial-type PARG catalytic domain-containing protein n=1 Tax=Botryobasidium botryosum (strain FD-172 SS1) TaxID=930990 RepID=A0A067MQ05_BOTB1|nr:hypothetical protein BOTBODRAFT_33077 [Botryobasidium botryosum FD-172 SS1]